MNKFTVEEVRYRCEADVRMWWHIDTVTWGKLGRPQVIEKDKGTDKTARRRGEHPPNGEATDITRSGVDDGCDLGRAAA